MLQKYLTINDNGIIKEIDIFDTRKTELLEPWLQVKHKCQFCKIQKFRFELNHVMTKINLYCLMFRYIFI